MLAETSEIGRDVGNSGASVNQRENGLTELGRILMGHRDLLRSGTTNSNMPCADQRGNINLSTEAGQLHPVYRRSLLADGRAPTECQRATTSATTTITKATTVSTRASRRWGPRSSGSGPSRNHSPSRLPPRFAISTFLLTCDDITNNEGLALPLDATALSEVRERS